MCRDFLVSGVGRFAVVVHYFIKCKSFKDLGLQTSESTHPFFIGAVSVTVWANTEQVS